MTHSCSGGAYVVQLCLHWFFNSLWKSLPCESHENPNQILKAHLEPSHSSCIPFFINWLPDHLLGTYYVPSIILGSGNIHIDTIVKLLWVSVWIRLINLELYHKSYYSIVCSKLKYTGNKNKNKLCQRELNGSSTCFACRKPILWAFPCATPYIGMKGVPWAWQGITKNLKLK